MTLDLPLNEETAKGRCEEEHSRSTQRYGVGASLRQLVNYEADWLQYFLV